MVGGDHGGQKGGDAPMDDTLRSVSRRLRNLVEPIAANVYFAPGSPLRYKAHGLSLRPGYFCSRAACMGRRCRARSWWPPSACSARPSCSRA